MSTEAYNKYSIEIESKLSSGKINIPVLPKVAAAVFGLAGNPNASLDQIADLVYRDQSLTSHVLKIANSAAFASRFEITSVKQAIARLGMRILSEIAMAVTMQGKFYKVPGFTQDVKNLNRHSLLSSQFAKEIGKSKGKDTEIMFLCGMIHALGKPVILQIIGDIKQKSGLDINADTLYELIEDYHIKVSDILAEKWELPEFLKLTMKFYKNYQMAPDFKDEIMITYLSDIFASSIVYNEKVSEEDVYNDPIIGHLSMDKAQIEDLYARKDEILQVVESMEF